MKIKLLALFIIANSHLFAQNGLMSNKTNWMTDSSLTWESFKGEVLDLGGFSGEFFCQILADFEKPTAFSKVKTNVNAVILTDKSWVLPAQKEEQQLLYFQVLFNIYELHARKLREEFSS